MSKNISEAEIDIINSPFAEALGWKSDKGTLTKSGKSVAGTITKKSWKKKKKELLWTNDKTGDKLTVGKRKENYWMIHLNKGAGWKAIYEGFKTKAKAIKHAKAYMRRK